MFCDLVFVILLSWFDLSLMFGLIYVDVIFACMFDLLFVCLRYNSVGYLFGVLFVCLGICHLSDFCLFLCLRLFWWLQDLVFGFDVGLGDLLFGFWYFGCLGICGNLRISAFSGCLVVLADFWHFGVFRVS